MLRKITDFIFCVVIMALIVFAVILVCLGHAQATSRGGNDELNSSAFKTLAVQTTLITNHDNGWWRLDREQQRRLQFCAYVIHPYGEPLRVCSYNRVQALTELLAVLRKGDAGRITRDDEEDVDATLSLGVQ